MPSSFARLVLPFFVASLTAQTTLPTMTGLGEDATEGGAVLQFQSAIAGDHAYATWITDDPARPIQWARSLDRGATWSAAAALPAASPSAPPSSFSSLCLHASGTDVAIVWLRSVSFTVFQVEVAVSHDAGGTWSLRPVPGADAVDGFAAEQSSIAIGGPFGVIASGDMGRSWSQPRGVGRAGRNLGRVMVPMQLRLSAGILHAAWSEQGPSPGYLERVFYNRSLDLGASWGPVDRPMSSTAPAGVAAFVVDGARVFLVWGDANGHWADRSLDGGTTWLPGARQLPIGPNRWLQTLLYDGATLVAVFPQSSLLSLTVNVVRSTDLGASWQAAASPILSISGIRLPRLAMTFSSNGAMVVAVKGRSTMIPWEDFSLWLASSDGGASWNTVAGFSWNLGMAAAMPRLVAEGKYLLAFWLSGSSWWFNQAREIHVGWIGGERSLGGSSRGTGGIAPSLGLDRVPVTGADYELHVRGRPGAPAIVALGWPRPPLPLFGGSLGLDACAYQFVLLGGPGSTAGTARLRYRVPYSGLPDFAAQAFVVDPAGTSGVAMSDAIELRLL